LALQLVSPIPRWGLGVAPPSSLALPLSVAPSANEAGRSLNGDPGRGLSLKVDGSPLTGSCSCRLSRSHQRTLTSRPSTSTSISASTQLPPRCILTRTLRCGSGDFLFSCAFLASLAVFHSFRASLSSHSLPGRGVIEFPPLDAETLKHPLSSLRYSRRYKPSFLAHIPNAFRSSIRDPSPRLVFRGLPFLALRRLIDTGGWSRLYTLPVPPISPWPNTVVIVRLRLLRNGCNIAAGLL